MIFFLPQEAYLLSECLCFAHFHDRNKLLSETLMRQHGEVVWKNMLDDEREKYLEKKQLEERRLRQEGKLDELGKLLADFAKVQFILHLPTLLRFYFLTC